MPAKAKRARAPRRRRSYHHGDLRRALLDAAAELIEREGVAALTLREVARRAGVSHAAPAHHFGDLLGLHRAIADEGFAALRAHMLTAAAGIADPAAALGRLGVAYVDFAVRSPGRFRAMFHPLIADYRERSPSPEAGAASDVLRDGIRAAFAEHPPSEVELAELALAAWAPMHGLASLAVDRQLEGRGLSTTDPVRLAEMLTRRLRIGSNE